jgi:hypothetical protein
MDPIRALEVWRADGIFSFGGGNKKGTSKSALYVCARYLKCDNYLLRKNTAIFFISFLDLLSLFRHFIGIFL